MSEVERLFGTNGFRGVVGRELTPEIAVKFGLAVGTYFPGMRVAVGMDGRTSSKMLSLALISGLQRAGVRVYDLGMLPTPVLQKYVREHEELKGGVMTTASHNPPEYNGFKVVGENGVELPNEEEKKVERIFITNAFRYAEWFEVRDVVHVSDAIPFYVREVLRRVKLEPIRKKKFKIVVDFGHGVSSLSIPDLLVEAECETLSMNSVVDGRFPNRPPEPAVENLDGLKKAVKASGAELGVAYDGDGDRSIFCDEKGNVWWGDVTGTIIAKYLAEKFGIDRIVTGVSSSCLVEEVLAPLNVKVIRTRVGSRNVTRAMLESGAIWGFEENGGGLFAPHQYVRDGGMTTMLMLQVLSDWNRGLAEICEELPKLFQVKTKVEVENRKIRDVLMKKIAEYYEGRKLYKIERVDGVKAWINERKWILIRPSGTEPVIRIFSEAESKREAEEMVNESKKVMVEITADLEMKSKS